MIFRNILYFFKEAVAGVTKNGWMTLASAGVTFATLLVLGIFIIFNNNLEVIVEDVKNQVEIVAYLDIEVEEEQIDIVKNELVLISGIKELRFVSKEDALERLRELLGDHSDITEGFDDRNPLPVSFEIVADNPDTIPEIAARVSKIPFIETVDYGQETVEKLFAFMTLVQWIGLGFMSVMLIMAIFLISNTIKLTVYARRKEISIMKSVGATDWFIRWPFILEGLFLGLIGSGLALLSLYYGYGYALETVYMNIPDNLLTVRFLHLEEIFPVLLRYLTFLGVSLGVIGSGISLRRFLKV